VSSYLQRRSGRLFFRLAVPRRLWPTIGREILRALPPALPRRTALRATTVLAQRLLSLLSRLSELPNLTFPSICYLLLVRGWGKFNSYRWGLLGSR
jgi:hypothetical protein